MDLFELHRLIELENSRFRLYFWISLGNLFDKYSEINIYSLILYMVD